VRRYGSGNYRTIKTQSEKGATLTAWPGGDTLYKMSGAKGGKGLTSSPKHTKKRGKVKRRVRRP